MRVLVLSSPSPRLGAGPGPCSVGLEHLGGGWHSACCSVPALQQAVPLGLCCCLLLLGLEPAGWCQGGGEEQPQMPGTPAGFVGTGIKESTWETPAQSPVS